MKARLVILAMAMAVGLCAQLSQAGGPRYIAGSSYFISSTTGEPLVWAQGQITYFTDQGDLSPVLPNASANLLVANAFSQWTSVSTAALNVVSGGQLAENVSGSNVIVGLDGVISMPADIEPTATGTPVGIVYDYDGSVTDAFLGSGAGDPSQCFTNAVYGGDDNFSDEGMYVHALIVINGQCALVSSQVIEIQYRLVRVLGNVLGLDWSQLNLNVITGSPTPTAADFAGFPVMHDLDPISCVPITTCYANPYQLAPDDVAAISRLYPVTAQNQSSFSGSQTLASKTGRIFGSVWFTGPSGTATQAMQGVNVVARWIDPTTNLPSRQYAVGAVSGFLFTGNAGNAITGFSDALGSPLSQWGSNETTVEGFFDLAGLPLPSGGSAQYQLSVEAIDPTWSVDVGPYAPYQVAPSGVFSPIVITVAAGQQVEQDILMSPCAQPVPPWFSTDTWSAPAAVSPAGDWVGSLGDYGDSGYFAMPLQANRTLSVSVTALDETDSASESKMQPVIGIWLASDPEGTSPPAMTPSPFNSGSFGMTQLDAQVATSGNFLIGISDLRGDGRPDYHYHANVLYADSVTPTRVGVSGGPVTVLGTGFGAGLAAALGTQPASPLGIDAGQMVLSLPPQADGPQSITISNPANGGSSTMTSAVIYGAAASDNLVLLQGKNPPTPVGTQATNPVRVLVLASDGVTPVSGATIAWSAPASVQLSACGGGSSCSVATDQSGTAETWLTPTAAAVSTITATLAPASYNPPQSVTATLNATDPASAIGVLTPFLWIAQGASLSTTLTARVLNNGVPQANTAVSFTIVNGSGTLSAASAQTNSTGYATVTLSVSQISALVQVSVCVAQAGTPCQTIYANAVPSAQLQLQPVAGAGQIISSGQPFQPVIVRATDSSSPPNAVLGAVVTFQTTILRPVLTTAASGNPVTPTILSVSQSSAASDSNGLASLTPSNGGFSGPLEVDVGIAAGSSAFLNDPLSVLPAPAGVNSAGGDFAASRAAARASPP